MPKSAFHGIKTQKREKIFHLRDIIFHNIVDKMGFLGYNKGDYKQNSVFVPKIGDKMVYFAGEYMVSLPKGYGGNDYE